MRVFPAHRTVAVAAAVTLLLTAAKCGDDPPATTAPAPAPAVVYPVSPKAHISYTLKTPPARWEITYQTGRLQLRDTRQSQIGYRIDPVNGGQQLVKNNLASGEKNGWKMEPITVDGGAGHRATYKAENGSQRLFYFFAKDTAGASLSVDLGPDGDEPAAKAAEELISSWKWAPTPVKGDAWPMPDPSLPFTYTMPALLVGQKQSATLRDYTYNLFWGNQSVQVVTSQGEDEAATVKFYEDKKAAFAKANATIRKFDDIASHDDEGLLALSKKVTEGFALKISEKGMPSIGAIVFYRKTFYCLISYQRNGTTPDVDGLAAMTAPFVIGGAITLREDLAA